jgi:homeobox protein cut-like
MASEEQAPLSPQVEGADLTSQATPFEQAIKTWSEIGLTSLQRSLDDQGVDILENQKASLISRKELASRTKTFKKLPDNEKLTEIKSLLKLYQSEIDNLTKRGKFAETSFMSIYKVLAEAPDPTPLLEASVDSVLSASEVSQLTDENTKLKNKLAKYADYENIKAKLMQLELKSIETSAAKVAAKEAEMNAVIEEKELYWATKEAELNKQVQEARNQVKDLRANNEVMQARLSAQSGDQLAGSIGDASAAQAAGRIAELELVASDLERAKRRTLEVEKRNVELRTELEATKSGSKEKNATAELEAQMSDLQRENILLTAQLESTRNSSIQAKSMIQKQVDSLQRDLTRKTTETESLRQKLSSMQDYQEIKKELEILKSVEFDYENSDNEDNDEENDNEDEPTDKNIQTNTESLEKLMLSRNKKLNNDLTVLRIANKNLTDEVADLKIQLEATAATLEKADRLNHKLEEDLLKTNPRSGTTMSVVSGWNRPGTVRSGRISPTASIIGGDFGGPLPSPSTFAPPSGGDTSILPIITQQRDRFKARNTELEEELRKNWATINTLRKEIESVKHDNVELYEKARYASSYKRNQALVSPNVSSTEDRYRTVYEEGLSPFQQFKGRETERALSKMGPAERIAYSFTRFILVNRLSRNLFMMYCLALHVLVMLMLLMGVGWHSMAVPAPEHTFVVHEAADAIPELPETAVESFNS